MCIFLHLPKALCPAVPISARHVPRHTPGATLQDHSGFISREEIEHVPLDILPGKLLDPGPNILAGGVEEATPACRP